MKKKNLLSLLAMFMLAWCVGFVSCGSDDEAEGDGGDSSALVGVWAQKIRYGGGYAGIRLGKGGNNFGYDEWDDSEDISDFSNMRVNVKWKAKDGRISISYDGNTGSWEYSLSEDGKTLYLSDHQGWDYLESLRGAFSKVK